MIRKFLPVAAGALLLLIMSIMADGLPIFDGFTIIQTKTIQGTSK